MKPSLMPNATASAAARIIQAAETLDDYYQLEPCREAILTVVKVFNQEHSGYGFISVNSETLDLSYTALS